MELKPVLMPFFPYYSESKNGAFLPLDRSFSLGRERDRGGDLQALVEDEIYDEESAQAEDTRGGFLEVCRSLAIFSFLQVGE